MLLCGFRKTIEIKSDAAARSCETLIGTFRASQKDVGKMYEALEHMKDDDA